MTTADTHQAAWSLPVGLDVCAGMHVMYVCGQYNRSCCEAVKIRSALLCSDMNVSTHVVVQSDSKAMKMQSDFSSYRYSSSSENTDMSVI